MIIWILNHYAVAPHTIGGTRHFDLARQMIKEGHTVRIFSSSFNHFERRETVKFDATNFKEEIIKEVNFTWIKTPSYDNAQKRIFNMAVFSFRLNNILSKYLKKEIPDLIIGSSVHPITALVGLKKASKVKSLFYFEERDLWPQTFIDFGLMTEKNIIAKLLFAIEKRLYEKSDRVIFLFEKAHEYAIKKGLSTGKPIYLPNGYSVERSANIKENASIKELISDFQNKELCMYVGSFGEANHLSPLIELANKMKEEERYHFLFVGDGPLKSDFINLVKERGLGNITFLNPIPKDQIPYLLSFAHCGLISMKDSPLYKWGFSMNKIYDYLALGLPIIAYTNLKDLGNLKNSNGFISSHSLDKLHTAILSLEDIDRESIKDFAYNNYSWDVLSRNFLKRVKQDLNATNESDV